MTDHSKCSADKATVSAFDYSPLSNPELVELLTDLADLNVDDASEAALREAARRVSDLPQEAPNRENLRPFAEWADRNRSAVSHEAADELILLARKACDAYGPLSRPEPQGAPASPVIADIAAERRRQIEQEGWTVEHDDTHNMGEMANAAAVYALTPARRSWTISSHTSESVRERLWPWSEKWWKPKNRRHDLIRAAALIVAEIERLDRKSSPLSRPEPQTSPMQAALEKAERELTDLARPICCVFNRSTKKYEFEDEHIAKALPGTFEVIQQIRAALSLTRPQSGIGK